MRFSIHMCKCDRCQKEVQLVGGQTLPEGWSLIASSTGRAEAAVEPHYPSRNHMNWATVCDACHSALFGDFWSLTMSSNGGPEHVLRDY